jgi:hypothetical protein
MSRMRRAVTTTITIMLGAGVARAQEPVGCELDQLVIACHAVGSPRAQLLTGTTIAGSEATGQALSQAIALEIATAPFGSSSGGFTFTFESDTRAWRRTAGTFGPAFAERALTIGRGRFSGGFNFLRRVYDNFDDLDLDNFEVFRFQGGTLPVTSSVFGLEASSQTLAGFAHYGLLDTVDVGVVVPYIWLDIAGTSRLFGAANQEVQRVRLDSSASGVGDIAVFGKVRILGFGPEPAAGADPHGAVAVAATVRLPTGSEDDLLGLGITRTHFQAIASATFGRWSPHANIGYEIWSAGFPVPRDFQGLETVSAKDQVHLTAGLEYEIHPRFTILGDVLGRYLRGAGGIGYQEFIFPVNPPNVAGASALVAVPDGLSTVIAAPGIKWNVFGNTLLTVDALIAVSGRGLRDRLTPVVGIDVGL